MSGQHKALALAGCVGGDLHSEAASFVGDRSRSGGGAIGADIFHRNRICGSIQIAERGFWLERPSIERVKVIASRWALYRKASVAGGASAIGVGVHAEDGRIRRSLDRDIYGLRRGRTIGAINGSRDRIGT